MFASKMIMPWYFRYNIPILSNILKKRWHKKHKMVWDKFSFPLVRCLNPELLFDQLIKMQPMDKPVKAVWECQYKREL